MFIYLIFTSVFGHFLRSVPYVNLHGSLIIYSETCIHDSVDCLSFQKTKIIWCNASKFRYFFYCSNCFIEVNMANMNLRIFSSCRNPVDTGHKLNVYKTFNLSPVSTGKLVGKTRTIPFLMLRIIFFAFANERGKTTIL